MSAKHHTLEAAYQQWRSWTERESAAIELADWQTVARCQTAKSQLQTAILELSRTIEREADPTEAHAGPQAPAVQELIQELIALEAANGERLQAQRQKALQRQTELQRTRRTLGRMQQSYVPSPKTHWQSYS